MADSDGPRLAVWVASSEKKVAARIDRKILAGSQFTGGEIDCEPLRNRSEVKDQRAKQSDGLAVRVEANVPIIDRATEIESGSYRFSGAIFAIEAAPLDPLRDRPRGPLHVWSRRFPSGRRCGGPRHSVALDKAAITASANA